MTSSQRAVLAAAIIGSSMTFIDGTVVNVVLPILRQKLGASAADAQWIVEAYMLFVASLLLVGGALGDQWGRRRVFLAAGFASAEEGIASAARFSGNHQEAAEGGRRHTPPPAPWASRFPRLSCG